MIRAFLSVSALVVPIFVVAGCDGSQDPWETLAGEIEINRSVWEATRPGSYRFVLQRQCFCLPGGVRPVVLEVEGNVVLSRTYADGGAPVPDEQAHFYPRISGLFDVLSEAVTTGADQVDVTWDPVTGVPVDFFIDYQQTVADEELGYTVVEGPEEIREDESGG